MTSGVNEPGSGYSRSALARLVLSDQAARAADYAVGLVSTRHDADTGNGGRAGQAAQLVNLARQTLVAAVIYERDRGSTWEEIGKYLETEPARLQAEFEPEVSGWRDSLDQAHRGAANNVARRHLPQAARDPEYVGEWLDRWAFSKITLTKDRHEVTGSLLGLPGPGAGPDLVVAPEQQRDRPRVALWRRLLRLAGRRRRGAG